MSRNLGNLIKGPSSRQSVNGRYVQYRIQNYMNFIGSAISCIIVSHMMVFS